MYRTIQDTVGLSQLSIDLCTYRNLLAGLALKVGVALILVLQIHQAHDGVDLQ